MEDPILVFMLRNLLALEVELYGDEVAIRRYFARLTRHLLARRSPWT